MPVVGQEAAGGSTQDLRHAGGSWRHTAVHRRPNWPKGDMRVCRVCTCRRLAIVIKQDCTLKVAGLSGGRGIGATAMCAWAADVCLARFTCRPVLGGPTTLQSRKCCALESTVRSYRYSKHQASLLDSIAAAMLVRWQAGGVRQLTLRLRKVAADHRLIHVQRMHTLDASSLRCSRCRLNWQQ